MDTLAVLISGGLDSAILVGDALRRQQRIQPIYIQFGLYWEAVELAYLRRFLEALRAAALQPLVILNLPVADLYGQHWSVTGRDVPAADSPDEAVFLPGRNVLLLSKALLWCHLHHVAAVALGSLATNPFADASADFFGKMRDLVNLAMTGNVAIRLPFAGMHKGEVMRLGAGLPLEHTYSCIRPLNDLHCGSCNKCAERRHAFAEAGMVDPSRYAREAD